MSFKEAWQNTIWPLIETHFNELLQARPCKVEDGAVGQHYGGKKVSEALALNGELRNVTCNLAWTKPLHMSPTNSNLSLAMVEKGAKSIWHNDGKPCIPALWPRGLNIPIACLSVEEPKKGEMERYGCCLAVCGFWLALSWAVEAKDHGTINKMRTLAVNVPFDFRHFPNEDAVLDAAAETMESSEMFREFFGLTGAALINLIVDVRDMLSRRTSATADPASIAAHLNTLRWYDKKRCPKKDTVEQLVNIGTMLRRSPRAQLCLEMASAKYGRDTIFDEPTKLLLMVQRSANPADFEFVVEGLYVQMLRTENVDRQSVAELKAKAGEVSTLLFLRRYLLHLERTYPIALPGGDPGKLAEKVRGIILAPRKWYEEIYLAKADSLTWTAGLPEPLALFLAHGRALLEGRLNEPLKGLLGSPPPSGAKPADLLKIDRVKSVFLDPFEKAYQSFTGKAPEDPKDGSTSTKQIPLDTPAAGTAAGRSSAAGTLAGDAESLRADARRHGEEVLAQRLVIVSKSASAAEMLVQLRNLESWQGLVNSRRFSGVYDPKNARLAKIYAGPSDNKKVGKQNWWQRVPAFIVADFQMWAKTVDALIVPGEDMVWVFSGKLRATERLLEQEFVKLKWESKAFVLTYDPRTMRMMYWVRERGVANAGMTETLFCCWKGRVPRCFPSNRTHVDPGSPLYYEVVNRVPVASEAELLWGSPQARDELLAVMGTDPAETGAEEPGEGPPSTDEKEPESHAKRKYPKRYTGRALYRVPSTDQVPLFPLDNSPRLLKEIAHESGSEPRVFVHGSPAGGAGVFGLLSSQALVVAFVQDESHGRKLRDALLERVTESALTPGGTFSSAELSRQAQELQAKGGTPAKRPRKAAQAESSSSGEEDSDGESQSDPEEDKDAKKDNKKDNPKTGQTPKKESKKEGKKSTKEKKGKTPKKDSNQEGKGKHDQAKNKKETRNKN